MFKLSQQSVTCDTEKMLKDMTSGNDDISFRMDKELIEADIAKYSNMLESTQSRENALNLKAIIKYLKGLEAEIMDDDIMEIMWKRKDHYFESFRVQLKSIPEYSLSAINYVKVKEEKMVVVDTTILANLIAFDMMVDDLGYEHDDMEELLKDTGMSSVADPKIMMEFFEKEDIKPFELSNIMRIGESPYNIVREHKIRNYFTTEKFDTDKKTYRDVVVNSCKTANSIIASYIYHEASNEKRKVKIIAIDATKIAFLIDENDDFDYKDLLQKITVRSFGRQFAIEPIVNIY